MASAFSLALPLVSSLFFVVTAQQSRAPHGLAFENPMSLPPSAVEFFHSRRSPPVHASAPCADPKCAHLAALSAASKARADSDRDTSTWSEPASAGGIRASSVAGIVLGLAFVVLVAMGASYVMAKRKHRANSRKASNVIKPEA